MATFVLLMPDTDAAEAERAVARLQSAAERMCAAKAALPRDFRQP